MVGWNYAQNRVSDISGNHHQKRSENDEDWIKTMLKIGDTIELTGIIGKTRRVIVDEINANQDGEIVEISGHAPEMFVTLTPTLIMWRPRFFAKNCVI
jgi:hypothetical protein